ncbi:uncharacterized protein LOC105833469 isoform X1 [Monomorium pharaonis]|uniref:uncharacterized protein LOC105833469 isoform X1 n=1 Tax=Monomorium pharaonis TaxID=307658 RepID=UPI0017464333|nr:uncharacterized protein LOC105833469 isoform X1 [Monomorium pharaonis]
MLPDGGGGGGSSGGSSRRRLFLTAATDRLATFGYVSRKGCRRKLTRAKVLRMLTPRQAGPVGPEEIGNEPGDKGAGNARSGSITPGDYENGDNSKEFLSSNRTGRRNALPDIHGRHAKTGLSDLSDRFEELSTHPGADPPSFAAPNGPNYHPTNSGQDPNIPSTSKQHG